MKAKQLLFDSWRFLAGLARPSADTNARRLRARGESAGSLIIRDATASDVPALARLHVTTWNATYAPLLVKGPSYDIQLQQWRDAFAKRAGDATWSCIVVEPCLDALGAEKTDTDPGNGNYGWRDLRNLAVAAAESPR